MNKFFAVVLVLVAIVGGIWLGCYEFLFKSIVEIVGFVQLIASAQPIDATAFAISICKILIGCPIVYYVAWTLIGLGIYIWD